MIVGKRTSLMKLNNTKNNIQDKVTDLNCNIETNLLLDEANMKIFRKYFLYNMDRIFKKIELIQKSNKDIKDVPINSNANNNEINLFHTGSTHAHSYSPWRKGNKIISNNNTNTENIYPFYPSTLVKTVNSPPESFLVF